MWADMLRIKMLTLQIAANSSLINLIVLVWSFFIFRMLKCQIFQITTDRLNSFDSIIELLTIRLYCFYWCKLLAFFRKIHTHWIIGFKDHSSFDRFDRFDTWIILSTDWAKNAIASENIEANQLLWWWWFRFSWFFLSRWSFLSKGSIWNPQNDFKLNVNMFEDFDFFSIVCSVDKLKGVDNMKWMEEIKKRRKEKLHFNSSYTLNTF